MVPTASGIVAGTRQKLVEWMDGWMNVNGWVDGWMGGWFVQGATSTQEFRTGELYRGCGMMVGELW